MLFCVTWSKYEKMAMKSLTYLRETVQTGPRHYPPHFVEFAAATVYVIKIFYVIVQIRVGGLPAISKHREELKLRGEGSRALLTNFEVF